MSVNSRKGKPIVTKRKVSGLNNVVSLELTIDEAFDRFLSIKKNMGVGKRTESDYYSLMGYFREWLDEIHSAIESITEITTSVIREYINYLKEE